MSDREKLASLSHDQWSGWMRWLFDKSIRNPDGSWTIPPSWSARWWNQMHTPYDSLSEEEKESDRKEADRVLECLKNTNQ